MEIVDLIVSWETWWKIVAAIVVGCGIYDLTLWSFETVVKGLPDLVRDVRRGAGRIWRKVSGDRISAAELVVKIRDRWFPDRQPAPARRWLPIERTPAAEWCFNEATRTLHLAECRYAGSCTPWYWASTFEEARYFAREQGLKVGCSCKPVGDLSAVSG